MAGSKNDTQHSAGYNLRPTRSEETTILQLETTAVQFINVSGSPEGATPANIGSIACDRTNGEAYLKVTGTGNTGWQQIVSGSAGGTTWNDVSGAFSPVKDNGYFVTATATGTLPASPAQGDTIKFFVDTTQILTIQASGSQIIRFGSAVTAAGGTAVSTAHGDSVELTYRTSGTCWCLVGGAQGTWTLT